MQCVAIKLGTHNAATGNAITLPASTFAFEASGDGDAVVDRHRAG